MRAGIVLALACVLLAPACGSERESAADGTNTATETASRDEPRNKLPPAVAKTRAAIVDAAKAHDYERLRSLIDPETFTYSFGESGDPIAYWRRLEEEGHVPILGDYLPLILSAPWTQVDGIYAWPSAYPKKPADWTAEDRDWLKNLYTEQEIRQFERAGAYLGWRVGIRKDGKWLFFVAGD